MKQILTAAFLTALSSPVIALENGSYVIGPQIFNLGAATPRYVHLDVEGSTINVTFVALYQPDASMCERTGMCEAIWPGLRLTMDGDTIASSEVTRADFISEFYPTLPDTREVDHKLYIAPVMAAIESGSPHILPLSWDGLLRTRALVQMLEVSAAMLGGCDVHQMSALEQSGDHAFFFQALDYQAAMSRTMDEATRVGPTADMPEAQFDKARAEVAPLQRTLSVMGMSQMAFASGKDTETGIAAARAASDRILKDTDLTFDGVMGPHLDTLPAASKLMQAIGQTAQSGTDLTTATCADITFGL